MFISIDGQPLRRRSRNRRARRVYSIDLNLERAKHLELRVIRSIRPPIDETPQQQTQYVGSGVDRAMTSPIPRASEYPNRTSASFLMAALRTEEHRAYAKGNHQAVADRTFRRPIMLQLDRLTDLAIADQTSSARWGGRRRNPPLRHGSLSRELQPSPDDPKEIHPIDDYAAGLADVVSVVAEHPG
jgi:hypothetical protein